MKKTLQNAPGRVEGCQNATPTPPKRRRARRNAAVGIKSGGSNSVFGRSFLVVYRDGSHERIEKGDVTKALREAERLTGKPTDAVDAIFDIWAAGYQGFTACSRPPGGFRLRLEPIHLTAYPLPLTWPLDRETRFLELMDKEAMSEITPEELAELNALEKQRPT